MTNAVKLTSPDMSSQMLFAAESVVANGTNVGLHCWDRGSKTCHGTLEYLILSAATILIERVRS